MAHQSVALITGASSGIGYECARLFAQAGYAVVLGARRLDRLEALQTEIKTLGGTALALPLNVRELSSIEYFVSQSLEKFDSIDVLVNNAGFARTKWLEELDPIEDINAQIETNLLGTIHCSHTVLPTMIERRSGHIINVVSVAGLMGTPTYSIYNASKFGQRGFTEALRREVGVYGVKISGIFPGAVDTEFDSHMQAERKTGITTPKDLRLSALEVAGKILHIASGNRSRMVIMPAYMSALVGFNQLFPRINDWLITQTFTKRERDL